MYTDKTALEKYLIMSIDSSMDAQLTEWITAMSREIDLMTNRTFVPPGDTPTTKVFDGSGSSSLLVNDFLSVSEVKIDGSVKDISKVLSYPANESPKYKLTLRSDWFPRDLQNVEVTGLWGYAATVPEAIKFVCTVLVAGIINGSNKEAGPVQSETIGRYSVSYVTKDQLTDYESIPKLLAGYKRVTF